MRLMAGGVSRDLKLSWITHLLPHQFNFLNRLQGWAVHPKQNRFYLIRNSQRLIMSLQIEEYTRVTLTGPEELVKSFLQTLWDTELFLLESSYQLINIQNLKQLKLVLARFESWYAFFQGKPKIYKYLIAEKLKDYSIDDLTCVLISALLDLEIPLLIAELKSEFKPLILSLKVREVIFVPRKYTRTSRYIRRCFKSERCRLRG